MVNINELLEHFDFIIDNIKDYEPSLVSFIKEAKQVLIRINNDPTNKNICFCHSFAENTKRYNTIKQLNYSNSQKELGDKLLESLGVKK